MSDSTPSAVVPASGQDKADFPFTSWWSIILTLLSGFAIYQSYQDWKFSQIKEPIVVKTATAGRDLTSNQLVEVHLALDLDEAMEFEYKSGQTFFVAPFAGTDRRLFFSTGGVMTNDRLAELTPPLRGRSGTKTFSDKWEVGDGKEANLEQVFREKILEDAIVIRTDEGKGISAWGWTLTGAAVIFLGYKIFVTFLWLKGFLGPATSETGANREVEPKE